MKRDVKSLMKLYDRNPTLVLFENLLDSTYTREKENLSGILRLGEKEKLNPIDVVLESLVNVISEDISRRELTHSEDKVLINSDVRNMAVDEILESINNDKRKLIKLHTMWMNALIEFLNELYQREGNLKLEEVIFLVSDQFRISALSGIKAIASCTRISN